MQVPSEVNRRTWDRCDCKSLSLCISNGKHLLAGSPSLEVGTVDRHRQSETSDLLDISDIAKLSMRASSVLSILTAAAGGFVAEASLTRRDAASTTNGTSVELIPNRYIVEFASVSLLIYIRALHLRSDLY